MAAAASDVHAVTGNAHFHTVRKSICTDDDTPRDVVRRRTYCTTETKGSCLPKLDPPAFLFLFFKPPGTRRDQQQRLASRWLARRCVFFSRCWSFAIGFSGKHTHTRRDMTQGNEDISFPNRSTLRLPRPPHRLRINLPVLTDPCESRSA